MIWLEAMSYIVTILGFPTAIFVIWREEQLRRNNEMSELHRNLSEEYDNFLRLVMENSDLLLLSRSSLPTWARRTAAAAIGAGRSGRFRVGRGIRVGAGAEIDRERP